MTTEEERQLVLRIKQLRARGFSVAGIARQVEAAPEYVAGVLHETWTTPANVMEARR